MATQTLHITKDTKITIQVGGDVSSTEIQNNFEGDITIAEEGNEPISSEAIDGTDEIIDSEAATYLITGLAKVKKSAADLWFKAAWGTSDTGSGAGVWQTFRGTGTSLDTDFTFENIQTSTGTGAGLKYEFVDSNVKIADVTFVNKDIVKFNYKIRCSNNNTTKYYRTEDLT